MKYYVMKAYSTTASDYIYLDNYKIPNDLKKACCHSDFQYVDKNLSVLKLAEESGSEFPDFIYDEFNEVPLISCRLKTLFDGLDIRNLFYQRIKVERKSDHISENYWLAIPLRIDCLDYENSEIDDLMNEASLIVINPDNVGNYEIFKLANVFNSQIIVTERLKNKVEEEGFLEGFGFIEINV